MVSSATLELYVTSLVVGRAGRPLTVHRLTADWAEDQVTWNARDSGKTWVWAGGDYDLTPLSNVAIESISPGAWVSFDVASAVQAWVNDPSSNQGLLIRQSENNSGSTFENRVHFAESEDPTTGNRPKLVAVYTGITVSPTSGLVTTESGGTATFTVVLASQPTAEVSISLSSSDATEGTVSPGSLTFDAANWNVPQTATVTGAEDAVIDGDIAYTIITAGASSADGSYNGLNPADVSVRNLDDDAAFTDIGAGLTDVSFSSVAWGDYDNDGDLDLALAGSLTSKIYRNDGGTFTDIGAGLTGVWYCSLAWGDYDNDGDLDLALAGWSSSGRISKIYGNDAGTFTDIGAGLTGVWYCSLAWGDYDNDGDLDLALAGSASSGRISKVYGNNGGTFTDIAAGLTGVAYASLTWGDYDNDGDLDLALAGQTGSGVTSKIYRNDAGTFTDIGAGLTGVFDGCSLAWGDYDNDGDLDLALAGSPASGQVSKVYRNDAGTFTDIGAGLTGVKLGSVAWGDYDSDGDLDLALAGWDGSGGISKVYRNDGGTFTDAGAGLMGVRFCSLAWGDYDNDGDVDLALAGVTLGPPVSKIYRNNGGVLNTAPAAPGGLGATYTGTGPYEVTFSWADSADAETPPAGLSYNLRVGTTPGGNEVFSGMADVATGWRRIPARGVAQPGLSVNEWALTLPAGMYYWSVQAVDTGFAGSAWAAEETLIVPAVVMGTIAVTLPAFAAEGDGTLAGAGAVSIPGMWLTDLVVDLQSNDTSELTVPATVTILQGDTSATFDLTIIDDGKIDGTETVAVTPTLAGWSGVPDSTYVLDNETQSITVTLPASATEGDGVLIGAGIVSIQGTWPVDLVVSLQCSDTTELTVSATAAILQGETSAAFDLTVEDDSVYDATQTATVTATAAGWMPGLADMNILDDEPPAIIPSGSGCSPAGNGHGSGPPTPAWLVLFLIVAGVRAASWGRSRASAGRGSTRKQSR